MKTTRSWSAGRLMLWLASCLLAGCGTASSGMPATYPVSGTAKFKDGTPVAGGAVQFISTTDSSLSVSGDVKDDGSFSLFTVKGPTRVAGAPEGEYRVSIQPPIQADHRPVPAITLSSPYKVEAKENTFEFTVAPPGKK